MMTRLEFLKLLWPPIFFPMLLFSGGANRQPATYQRWEYYLLHTDYEHYNSLEDILKYQGDLGWELVEIYGDTFIFKRPNLSKPQ